MRKVLISPGFGAGWSTWNSSNLEIQEFMLFHSGIISAVESGDDIGFHRAPLAVPTDNDKVNNRYCVKPGSPLDRFVGDFEARWPGEYVCLLGAENLRVVTVMGRFIVEEYDGSESLRIKDEEEWFW